MSAPGGGSTVGNVTAYLRMEADQYIRKAREATRATLEMEAAQRRQQKALSDVARAEKNLHDAQRSGDTQKITRATTQLENARERLATANDRVVIAEKKLQSETERTAATIERTAERAARSKEAAARRIEQATRRETREAEQAARKAEQLARSAERSDRVHLDNRLRNIIAASVILGPALVPIGAAAIGGLTAFTSAAGVALLAVRGIKSEMKAGSQVGLQYQSIFETLQSGLDDLSRTAAKTALPYVAKAANDIGDAMPELSSQTEQFTKILGETGDVLVHGVIQGFIQLRPLTTDVLNDVLHLAQGFDRFASGTGITKFGDYAQEVLPIVEKDLSDIAEAFGKLIISASESGVTVLDLLGGIARALNAIPLPVLKIIVPTLLSIYTASKLVAIGTTLNIRLGGLYAAMMGRETVATLALAAAQRELAVAEGEAGAAGVAAGVGSGAAAAGGAAAGAAGGAAARGAATGEGALARAGTVARTGGAIASGAFPATAVLTLAYMLARKLDQVPGGGNRPLLTGGNVVPQGAGGGPSGGFLGGKLTGAIAGFLFGKSQAQGPKPKAPTGAEALVTSNRQADAASAKAAASAFDSLAKSATSAENAQANEMATARLSGSAHDVLAASLSALNDKYLNNATAVTAQWQAINQATKILKDNKGAIKGHSDAALEDQAALQGATKAIQDRALAMAQGGASEGKSIAALVTGRDNLFKNLKAQGLLTKAVQNYINSILHIPKWVSTLPKFTSEGAKARMIDYIKTMGGIPALKHTTFDAKTGLAITKLNNLLTVYNALTDKTVTISYNIFGRPGRADLPQAEGGLITGPGGPKSDDIPIMASNGEFVVNAAQTAKNLDLLEQINKGVGGFAAGGHVGFASGGKVHPLDPSVRNLLNAALTGFIKAVRDATASLKSIRQKELAEAGTIKSAAMGSFNLTGTQYADRESLFGALSGAVGKTRGFAADLKAAGKRGLSKSIIQQLAEAGPDSTGITADTIAHLTAAQIRQLNAMYGALGSSSGALGRQVAHSLYASAEVRAYQRIAKLRNSPAERKAAAAARKLHKPAQIEGTLELIGADKAYARGFLTLSDMLQYGD